MLWPLVTNFYFSFYCYFYFFFLQKETLRVSKLGFSFKKPLPSRVHMICSIILFWNNVPYYLPSLAWHLCVHLFSSWRPREPENTVTIIINTVNEGESTQFVLTVLEDLTVALRDAGTANLFVLLSGLWSPLFMLCLYRSEQHVH